MVGPDDAAAAGVVPGGGAAAVKTATAKTAHDTNLSIALIKVPWLSASSFAIATVSPACFCLCMHGFLSNATSIRKASDQKTYFAAACKMRGLFALRIRPNVLDVRVVV